MHAMALTHRTSVDSAADRSAIEHEARALLVRATPLAAAMSVTVGALLVLVQWPVVEPRFAVAWLALIALVSLGRYLLARRAAGTRAERTGPARSPSWPLAGEVANGLLWGAASWLLFATDSRPHQVFLAFAVAGMAAGSITTGAFTRASAAGFAVPALVPLAARFLLLGDRMSVVMGLMTLLLLAGVLYAASALRRTVRENIAHRLASRARAGRIAADSRALRHANEALQRLHSITARQDLTFDARIEHLLALGNELFGLELGIVSRIDGDTYRVDHAVGPPGAPAPGTEFALGTTYCVHTLAADGPVAIHHVGDSPISGHPCYRRFGLESYLGVPLIVDGERYGTVNFTAAAPRKVPFDDTDCTLVRLLAEWIGRQVSAARAEARLARQKGRFESLFHYAPDAVVFTDRDRRIQLVNPAFTRLFGYPPAEVVGRTTRFLYADPGDYEAQARRRFNLEAGADPASDEVDYRRRDGTVFPGETVATPAHDAAGELFGVIGHVRDISERRRIDRLKNEFVSTVSHELRTPLTAIRGALGLLARQSAGELPASARPLVAVAERNSERLARLIDDILDIDLMASGQLTLERHVQPVMALVTQALEANRIYAERLDVGIRLQGTTDARVDVDPDRFLQVMANLLSNAARFSPPGGTVTVDVAAAGDSVRIAVNDQGDGIAAELHERIFEKFTQVDGSDSRRKGGSGLGLWVSRSLVERMGGRIDLDSSPGRGATFAVSLPRAAAPEPHGDTDG